jgi:hypothetical protein
MDARLGEAHPRHGRAHVRCRDPFIPPKGDSCLVKNIPVELLSRMFQFGTGGWANGDVQNLTTNHACTLERVSQSSSDARLPYPFFPTAVFPLCQHWRHAAISIASLWASISPVSQPPFQHVAALLERSKRLPIDLCVHFTSQEDGGPRITLLVARYTCTVDFLIMHSSMHYEITTKSIQLFAESVQNPNMHYENFYAL